MATPYDEAPVDIPYAQLLDPACDVSAAVAAGFGRDGLGLLTVSGVPGLAAARRRLLPLAARFAALPAEVKARYEDPESTYNFGWSCGREALSPGRPDALKGSYYANPLVDDPAAGDAAAAAAAPSVCRPNVWPRADLPALEGAFKRAGALAVRVGLALAARCDAYVAAAAPRGAGGGGGGGGGGLAEEHSLEATIRRSRCHKGRLLHYFPPPEGEGDGAAAGGGAAARGGAPGEDTWCGWHTDHGALTALLPAMMLPSPLPPGCGDEAGGDGDGDGDGAWAAPAERPCPDPAAGLWVRARGGRAARVALAPGRLAFQVGEAATVLSGGLLVATPHCVAAPRRGAAAGGRLSRESFAVFMQPAWDAPLAPPAWAPRGGAALGVPRWAPGLTFGEFTARALQSYHERPPKRAVR